MELEVTPEAAGVVRRALELTDADPATTGVRLHVAKALGGGTRVQTEFADEPAAGEDVVEAHGLRLFVDPALAELVPDPILTVDPQHDNLAVRPRA